MRCNLLAFALVHLALAGCATVSRQPPPAESGAFLMRESEDRIVGMEVYTRTDAGLRGHIVIHRRAMWEERVYRDSTGTCHHQTGERDAQIMNSWYRAMLRPDGTISRFEVAIDSAFTRGLSAEFDGDSATVRPLGATDPALVRFAAQGPVVPFHSSGSLGIIEQVVRRVQSSGRDSVPFTFLILDLEPEHRRAYPMSIALGGGGRVRMNTHLGTWRIRVDARGRLLSLDPRGRGELAVAERVRGPLDLERFRAASEAEDAAWQRPQPLTFDEVQARCGPAPRP